MAATTVVLNKSPKFGRTAFLESWFNESDNLRLITIKIMFRITWQRSTYLIQSKDLFLFRKNYASFPVRVGDVSQ
uniref:Uncharacterized protein n=1 Tax=Octopus bimaculoides TaxID=37653 RepID=A0A0L8GKH2_OCTBM